MKFISRAFNSFLSLFLLLTLAGCADLNTRVNQLEAENNAQQAEIDALNNQFMELEICPPGAPTRFIDNGDGTVCDSETGLMWEKKYLNGTFDPNEFNQFLNIFIPNSIYNSYSWAATSDQFNTPTGTVFTDFLARLNIGRFAGYNDWRIPTYEEALTLFSGSDPIGQNCVGDFTGQSSTDPIVCTHPVFGSDLGTWVVHNMLSISSTGIPRDYQQFQWPDNLNRPYLPSISSPGAPVRAVRGSLR